MRMLAIVCNVLSGIFTCLVVATDGMSREPAYALFTLLLIVVPLYTAYALASRVGHASVPARRAAVVFNVVLLAGIAAAVVDQYPHPNEPGFVPYVLLMVFTPLLSIVALVVRRPRRATA
jgi:hypothetical protein